MIRPQPTTDRHGEAIDGRLMTEPGGRGQGIAARLALGAEHICFAGAVHWPGDVDPDPARPMGDMRQGL